MSHGVSFVVGFACALAIAYGLWGVASRRARGIVAVSSALADAAQRRESLVSDSEQLLRAALDATPSAVVLFSESGRIVLTNEPARQLFFEGRNPQGEDFLSMIGGAPAPLQRALSGEGEELISVEDANRERHTYHFTKRHFSAAGQPVVLVTAKNLSREMHRQEADAWKRMIRVFSHELNNSLAPISSLVHSARVVVADSTVAPKLERIFATIAERAEHLRSFLEGYARLARLPPPVKQGVDWQPFIARLLELWPTASLVGELPSEPGWFDRAQLEQVAINLLKNAEESGGAPCTVTLSVSSLAARGVRFTVADRGTGMSQELVDSGVVPFYSTKEGGSGLGLPLCREIVAAHGGSLRFENREGGGVAVHVRLPGRSTVPDDAMGKLTLSRT